MPHFPRLRALALFSRRPPHCVVRPSFRQPKTCTDSDSCSAAQQWEMRFQQRPDRGRLTTRQRMRTKDARTKDATAGFHCGAWRGGADPITACSASTAAPAAGDRLSRASGIGRGHWEVVTASKDPMSYEDEQQPLSNDNGYKQGCRASLGLGRLARSPGQTPGFRCNHYDREDHLYIRPLRR